MRVLKFCGKPGNCNKEELIKSHEHNELKPIELLSLDFEKNLKTRSSVETKPLPQVYREEEYRRSCCYKYLNNPQSLDEVKIKDDFT